MEFLRFIWWLAISFVLVGALGLTGLLVLIIIITLAVLLRDKTNKVKSSFIAGNIIGICLGLIMVIFSISFISIIGY